MLRPLLLALASLASFATVCALQRTLVPWPSEYGLRAKWEWLRERPDEYSAIFIGSSVTFYGIVPDVFDAVLAERGYPVRSFNLGVGGMMPIEADHVLREVLALEPENLRYVFMESGPWEGRIYDVKNTYSPRMVHWHDWLHTRYALECLQRAPEPPEGKPDWRREDAKRHAFLFARKLTAMGQGLRTVRALFGLDADELHPSLEELERLRGYVDLDVIEGEEWERRRERFEAGIEQYKQRVVQVGPGNKTPIPVERHRNPAGLAAQLEAIEEAGALPAYYLGPRVASDPLSYRLAEAGLLPVLFGFNRPGKYPELYAIENHFDPNHLNRAGAEEFTRLFATEFADYLDARVADQGAADRGTAEDREEGQ